MVCTLGQLFIVENVVGAGGTTGSLRAMRARPDGYTILTGHIGTHAFSVSLYPTLAYKPDVDFEPVGLVFQQPTVIVARKDFPAKDLKEFIGYAKANAEKLNMGHAGVGSITFTLPLLLNSLLGIKPTMVPFNGAAPALNALMGGQVDYMCNGIADIGQQVQTGTIKAYAVVATERHPILPNVPTTIEAGLPEFQALPWWALFAPKGVPQAILRPRRRHSGQREARPAATRSIGKKRDCSLDADHQSGERHNRVRPTPDVWWSTIRARRLLRCMSSRHSAGHAQASRGPHSEGTAKTITSCGSHHFEPPPRGV